ncbi:hypothetical protein [Poseidonocella sp. HB161398]|uniref:hypothetical protein n=1 Tax=Poseidonocella sp. HB161398 TaxID=2320855 RepID=UPI001107F22E|nr:hypothetical protein [Poseidonocella sp. HB161398]
MKAFFLAAAFAAGLPGPAPILAETHDVSSGEFLSDSVVLKAEDSADLVFRATADMVLDLVFSVDAVSSVAHLSYSVNGGAPQAYPDDGTGQYGDLELFDVVLAKGETYAISFRNAAGAEAGRDGTAIMGLALVAE